MMTKNSHELYSSGQSDKKTDKGLMGTPKIGAFIQKRKYLFSFVQQKNKRGEQMSHLLRSFT